MRYCWHQHQQKQSLCVTAAVGRWATNAAIGGTRPRGVRTWRGSATGVARQVGALPLAIAIACRRYAFSARLEVVRRRRRAGLRHPYSLQCQRQRQ